MGKLVVSEFVSLDGVIEDPGGFERTPMGGWTSGFPTPDGTQRKFQELMDADVLLLGRTTYDGFAAAWPSMEEVTGDYGKKMNSMPKYVVSSTLRDPSWKNTTVLAGDIATEVAKLKAQYSGDILVFASGTLVEALRDHDLVDEYRLMVHPIIVGQGKRLFSSSTTVNRLELVESVNVGPDVLLLTYRPAPKPAADAADAADAG
jgi:dihydrofolate reductase